MVIIILEQCSRFKVQARTTGFLITVSKCKHGPRGVECDVLKTADTRCFAARDELAHSARRKR